MKNIEKKAAILLLEDGTVFNGYAAGKTGTTTGEICFTTGMTGYQEVFTDPSYYGQILVATNVHIGNYGIRNFESESDSIKINGFVCRNFTNQYSRKIANSSIQDYFLEENLVAISGVDTRALVRHIRSKGAMNAIISSEILDIDVLKEKLREVPSMEGLELSSEVTTSEPYFLGNADGSYKVAVLDYGIKRNILRHLEKRHCYLRVFPAKTTFREMEEWGADGYFISNGPGDPASMDYAVETIKDILDADKPFFGICLGQQLFALALGMPTYKMHHGHRGLNHPVLNTETGLCEVTSQNHGFGVVPDAVKEFSDVEVTHLNLNDDTVEGIRHKTKNAFSVQFHPETAPGPHDSEYLFDQFIDMMKPVEQLA